MGPDRLERLLGGPELAWLVARVRRRLERGEPPRGAVTLAAATPAQRDAAARLLGRPPRPGGSLTIRLDDVDAVLRSSGASPDGLAAAVIALTGPIRDRANEAAALEEAWRKAFAPLDVAAARPELRAWADALRSTGTIRRIARTPSAAGSLIADLAAVLAALPCAPQPVGRFAERVLGSAHSLDPDRPLTGLVFGAARALGGVGDGEGAAWRRDVWASVGLLRDELSSTVLVLNLPAVADTPTGYMLASLRKVGEPAVLTLRQLRQPPGLQLAGTTVSICENPVVVAEAAETLGPGSAPLVCVGGQPGVAAMTLLRAMAEAGARLRYHGDFDWGGLRIGNVVFGRLPAEPWRFDAASYRSVRGHGRRLVGEPVACVWDPALTVEMSEAGYAVEEERVLDDLLDDLAVAPG